jgi:hypothetical protein
MPDMSEFHGPAVPDSPPPSIADRVRDRLIVAGVAFDRRLGASRPKARRLRERVAAAPPPAMDDDPFRARERACLRMVFRELGDTHRRYRARTAQSGTPALRAAAHAFKQEPSLGSLVPVAAFLDEIGILGW